MKTKQQIRQQLLKLRTAFQATDELKTQITTTLINHPAIQAAKHVGCYMAMRGEVDLLAFIQLAKQANKNIYLPVCAKDKMAFFPFNGESKLKQGKYDIPEPSQDTTPITTTQLDVVLTPLLGFTTDNYRLGYGAGYYDRLFAYKIVVPHGKPKLIGVAFDFQLADWPTDSFDVPLDEVIVIPTTNS